MDDSRRNEELLARMEVNNFTIDKDSHCSALDTETLRKSRVYVGRRTWGMSRELLKLSGSLVHDYATISDDSPSPNRASRARRAATSAGIS